MCRLLGYLGHEAAPLRSVLIDPANSLRNQSRQNQDGWGISSYQAGSPLPEVRRGLNAAFQDSDFEDAANTQSPVFIAHVRAATVGATSEANCHPFSFGPWSFAHNGTVRHFAEVRPELLRRIDSDLRAEIKGQTDSEACFHLFLTELRKEASDLEHPTPEQVARSLRAAVVWLSERTDRWGEVPTATNFLVTNGELMVATRHHRTLSYVGSPAAPTEGPLDRLLIASSPLGGEASWRTVPEGSILAVEGASPLLRWDLKDLNPLG